MKMKCLLSLSALLFTINGQARTVIPDNQTPAASLYASKVYHSFRIEPYENWVKSSPAEAQALALFPGYKERQFEAENEFGIKEQQTEKLTVFIAKARFVVTKPINLSGLLNLSYIKTVDASMEHRQIGVQDIFIFRKPNPILLHNTTPSFKWCENRTNSICVESKYSYPIKYSPLIAGANTAVRIEHKVKGQPGEPRLYDYFSLLQSELRYVTPQELSALPQLTSLTGQNSPVVGGIEQSIFYFNQMGQFGKSLAIVQQLDASRSLITSYVAVGIKTKNLDGSRAGLAKGTGINLPEFLMGKSFLNAKDCSLMAGYPAYTGCLAKNVAELLEK